MKQLIGQLLCSIAKAFGVCKPVTVTVVQTVEVPVPLKDFPTFGDLEAWFLLHDELRMPEPNLCDDYARESRILAEVDGYVLSYCLVADGVVYQSQVFDKGVYHIANMAIVDKDETHDGLESCYYCDLGWSKLIYLTGFFSGGKY